MKSSESLSIKSLQHIGIPVTDIGKSEAFYARLGFVNVMQAPFEHEGGKGLCMMVKRGDIILELYQMPASILKTMRERKDGHIDHIAFDVSDIDATFQWFKEQGFTIVEESP